jgi:hypothetical protein
MPLRAVGGRVDHANKHLLAIGREPGIAHRFEVAKLFVRGKGRRLLFRCGNSSEQDEWNESETAPDCEGHGERVAEMRACVVE